ncbi:MAG: tetratricopeptide repeat protein [Myxococcales bacterium]|nr:tetratricopeptide repeat protein [Myxococcales bacterium]
MIAHDRHGRTMTAQDVGTGEGARGRELDDTIIAGDTRDEDTRPPPRLATGDADELGVRDTAPSGAGLQQLDADNASEAILPGWDTLVSDARQTPIAQPPADVEERRVRELIKAKLFRTRAVPVKIGRFTVLSRLGEGGMGVVYAAYDEALDRKIAVKVLRSVATTEDDLGRVRLLREAQAMARLSHPNIVTVHEVGELDEGHGKQVFVAMEFVRGQTLQEWIAGADAEGRQADGPRPWREVVEVFRQAGAGLVAAHEAGIVHRDFKPGNVLVGDDGVVKVLDFGLARALPHAGTEALARTLADSHVGLPAVTSEGEGASMLAQPLTRTGAIMGTPAYMSPEQHMGTVATAQSDLFSFCVALFEGLYGEHPFPCESLPKLVDAVIHGRHVDPPAGVAVPGWVRRVVLQGLRVEPRDRPPSMAALLAALARDPARARRRWVLGLGLVGVTATGSFALAGQVSAPVETCVGADEELAEVWSATRRAALERALSRTGLTYAADTWARVDKALTRYAGDWVAMRTEACEAHEDGRQSDRLLDRRMACLDGRRAALAGLVDSLTNEPDAASVQNAVQAAASLPTIAYCGDAEALTAELAPPEDADARARVEVQRQALARAKVLEDLGRYDDALARSEDALAQARALEYRPLLAEAELRRGSALMQRGDGEDARAALDAALYDAIAIGHAAVAAEAVAKRIFARSRMLDEVSGALEDEPLARSLLERSPARADTRWLLSNNLGLAYEKGGQLTQARRLYADALETLRARGDADAPEYAYTLANLAEAHGRALDFDEAARLHGEALASLQRALGDGHPHVAFAAYNVGLAQLNRGDLVGAASSFARAEQGITAALGDAAPAMQFVQRSRGDLANAARRHEEARARFESARELLHRHGLAEGLEASHVASGLGEAYVGLRRFDDARAELERARTLRARLVGPRSELAARSERDLGALDRERGELGSALGAFGRALEIRRALAGADEGPEVAESLVHLGHAQRLAGRLDEARVNLERALKLLEARALQDGVLYAELARRLGELERDAGAHASARGWFTRARDYYARVRAPGDPLLALLDAELARCDMLSGGSGRDALARAVASLRAAGPGYARDLETLEGWLAG